MILQAWYVTPANYLQLLLHTHLSILSTFLTYLVHPFNVLDGDTKSSHPHPSQHSRSFLRFAPITSCSLPTGHSTFPQRSEPWLPLRFASLLLVWRRDRKCGGSRIPAVGLCSQRNHSGDKTEEDKGDDGGEQDPRVYRTFLAFERSRWEVLWERRLRSGTVEEIARVLCVADCGVGGRVWVKRRGSGALVGEVAQGDLFETFVVEHREGWTG